MRHFAQAFSNRCDEVQNANGHGPNGPYGPERTIYGRRTIDVRLIVNCPSSFIVLSGPLGPSGPSGPCPLVSSRRYCRSRKSSLHLG